MKFSRKVFWDGFRAKIDDTIEQEQVDGLEFLLDKVENDRAWKNIPEISYAFATTYHETAGSFQPVTEGYYLAKTDPPDYAGNTARVKRFQKTLRYYPYHGRGYVQLTWKKNYEKAAKVLGMDLVNHPELALDREGAYLTMTAGMHEGWFTGKKLSDYISDTGKDYKNARKIINGLDKATLIAGYARTFEEILRASKINSAATPTATKPDTVQPAVSSDKGDDPASIEGSPINEKEWTEGERPKPEPNVQINNAENVNVEKPAPPPQSSPVTVTKERTSIWTKIAVIMAAITGMGINIGNVVNNKLNEMNLKQLGYAVCGVAIIAIALWAYDRAQARAQVRTLAKMRSAADPASNTVEIKP